MPDNRRLKIEKSRANSAFNDVDKLKEASIAKKYKSLVKKTPARIKNCGFTQTLSFIFSKKKKDNHFEQLYSQLKKRLQDIGYISQNSQRELMNDIVVMDKVLLRSVTNEALAYLTWLKRFTEGMIDGEENAD